MFVEIHVFVSFRIVYPSPPATFVLAVYHYLEQ